MISWNNRRRSKKSQLNLGDERIDEGLCFRMARTGHCMLFVFVRVSDAQQTLLERFVRTVARTMVKVLQYYKLFLEAEVKM
jgi:hypothetical protein